VSAPKLAPPGAGLAWHQWLFTRWIIGPIASKKTTWEENLAKFARETQKINALIAKTPKEKLRERVLVAPRFGLEDSSRYWSVAMALEHLVIVGTAVTEFAIQLSRGKSPTMKADTAKVKPLGEISAEEAIQRFETFSSQLEKKLSAEISNKESSLKHAHPWFGPFTTKQWVWLLGVHQGIHRKQIEDILRGL
jgi:hypothetical protein